MIESTESFGKYTLIERVAVGGMAEIFKAKTHGIDGFEKLLAIKRLHRRLCDDQDFAMMLVDEAKISVQLNHANIGQVFDLGYFNNQYFIVMEYIDGLDMHQVLRMLSRRRQRIPKEVAVYVAAQACEALHYAHNKTDADGRSLEIIHRDVSPQNVMVSRDGEVKLVDFGIAKARMRAQQTQAGIIKGKFYYMSPEQANGKKIDRRTDVYAVGILLYEMLAGKNPYEEVEDAELLQRVRQAEFAPITQATDVDGELGQIIEGALARNVEQRFQSALDLQRALLHYAHRRLRPFSRIELAEFVAALRDPAYDVGGERATFPAMRKQEYVLGGDSVIFDANLGQEVGDADSTRVFERNGVFDESPARVAVATATAIIHDDGEPQNWDGLQKNANSARPHAAPGRFVGKAKSLWAGKGDRAAGADFRRPGKSRGRMLALASGGLVVAMIGIVLVMAFMKPNASSDFDSEVMQFDAAMVPAIEPELISLVTLPVTSVPANAQVYLNGEFYGDTPVELRDLSVGTAYTLMLRRTGFADVTMQVMVETSMDALVVPMKAQQGVLKVSTYPAGAMITLNGEELGQAPVTAMELSREDEHQIVAELKGHERIEKSVRWHDSEDRIKEIQIEFETTPAAASADAEKTAAVVARPRPKKNVAPKRTTAKSKESSKKREPLNIFN